MQKLSQANVGGRVAVWGGQRMSSGYRAALGTGAAFFFRVIQCRVIQSLIGDRGLLLLPPTQVEVLQGATPHVFARRQIR